MDVRRVVVATLVVAGILGLVAAPAGAVAAQRTVPAVAVPAAAVPSPPAIAPSPVLQTDWGAFLFGLLLQGIGHGLVDWGDSIMRAAIAEGSAAYFTWQIGKSLWDWGCEWGKAGEALTPGVPPTFPFLCTLYPPWPY